MPILIEDFQEYLNGITGLVMEEGENEDYEPIYKIKLWSNIYHIHFIKLFKL